MSLLRYLGMVVGDAGDLASLPAEPGLGRFVPVGEPLPVGTSIEVEGVSYRVTRVDEGVVPGCWLRAEGAAAQQSDEMPTVRELAPAPAPAPVPAPAAPEPGTPQLLTPAPTAPEPGTPQPVAPAPTDEAGGKKKGKRRGGKTVIGR